MGVIPVNSLRTTPTVPKPTFSITITTSRRERTPAFFAPAVRITKVCIKRTNKSARGYGTTKMAPLNQQEITRNLDQLPGRVVGELEGATRADIEVPAPIGGAATQNGRHHWRRRWTMRGLIGT